MVLKRSNALSEIGARKVLLNSIAYIYVQLSLFVCTLEMARDEECLGLLTLGT
jgi:hypothetical protein